MKTKFNEFLNEGSNNEPTYDGDIINFLENLNDTDISDLLDELSSLDELDERMYIVEQILSSIEENHGEYYDLVEDDVRDLTL